jgi:hypothetical protein
VLATFATERTDGLLADGENTAAALNSGYHLAYLIGAALIGIAIVVALRAFRSESPAAAKADQAISGAEPSYADAL